MMGYRRHNTPDTSRNCPLLTPLVPGEQWHNDHHANQTLVRQGSRWWEIDVTFYLIWLLQFAGITKNLRMATRE
jgi:stearoyl-CoA desaturase (Delta-9 desaturase)